MQNSVPADYARVQREAAARCSLRDEARAARKTEAANSIPQVTGGKWLREAGHVPTSAKRQVADIVRDLLASGITRRDIEIRPRSYSPGSLPGVVVSVRDRGALRVAGSVSFADAS